jgi:hypothetical protein
VEGKNRLLQERKSQPLDGFSRPAHSIGMAKDALAKNGSYRVSGRTRDGVEILTPNTAPSHFTPREIQNVITRLVRSSAADRRSDRSAAFGTERKK